VITSIHYTFGDAFRRRCGGDGQHAAHDRLQRPGVVGILHRAIGCPWTVRHAQDRRQLRPAAAAPVFHLRGPAGPIGPGNRILDLEQTHRRLDASLVRGTSRPARGVSGTARPAIYARRSTVRSLDGRRRGGSGALRGARSCAPCTQRIDDALLWSAERVGALSPRPLQIPRCHARRHDRRRHGG